MKRETSRVPWPTVPGPEPYTVETEFDGRLSVCDSDVNTLATFAPEYRDLAEEMRDRLIMRKLAGER